MQNIKFVEVKGNCMMPFLSEKTVVAFKPASFSEVMPQDIAVLKIRGVYMIHRITGKFRIRGRCFFIHKGDAGKIPLVAPSCALAGKAVVEQTDYNRSPQTDFILTLKIILIKLKIWLKLIARKV